MSPYWQESNLSHNCDVNTHKYSLQPRAVFKWLSSMKNNLLYTRELTWTWCVASCFSYDATVKILAKNVVLILSIDTNWSAMCSGNLGDTTQEGWSQVILSFSCFFFNHYYFYGVLGHKLASNECNSFPSWNSGMLMRIRKNANQSLHQEVNSEFSILGDLSL